MTTRTAIIYARWSSKEQSSGSTLERQIKNTTSFAEREGLSVVEQITDSGVSAYTGANLTRGNLANLIDEFSVGIRDASTTVLLVERLDRLSRVDQMTALSWITRVTQMGLRIIVTNSGQVIDADLLRNNITTLMTLIMENFQSNFESKKKAERLAAGWESARSKGKINPNIRAPAWLEVKNGELVAKAGAKETINYIFDLNLAGKGPQLIAKRLNEEGLVPWALHKRSAKIWTSSRIKRILYSDKVIGFYTPHISPRSRDRVRAGEKIRRYPQLVSDEKFNRVQAQRSRGRGGRSNIVKNLFPTICRCFECGGAMAARGSAVKGHYYIYCTTRVGGGQCNHKKGWRYDEVEKPIVDQLLTRALTDSYFQTTANVEMGEPKVRELAELRTSIRNKSSHLVWLLEQQTDFEMPEISTVHAKVSKELKAARVREAALVQELELAAGKVTRDEHIERVRSVRNDLESADDEIRNRARTMARDAFAELIEKVEFDADCDNIIVHLAGGVGTFVILYGHGSLVEHSRDLDLYKDHPRYKTIERFIQSA